MPQERRREGSAPMIRVRRVGSHGDCWLRASGSARPWLAAAVTVTVPVPGSLSRLSKYAIGKCLTMKCRYLHVSADIMSVTVSICMYLQVPCQYLHVCVDIRWFLIPQLRFWSPFWSGRDHYSVQKIFSKRKRNSVLQNGNGVELFHHGDALLLSIRPM